MVRREALALAVRVGVKRAGEQLDIARPAIYDWRNQAEDIWSFKGHSTSKTLKSQGRFMNCRNVPFMLTIRPEWMASYVAGISDGGGALDRMVQRIANRKSPILFIIRGVPGGRLQANEMSEYPDGHFYAFQENAWMDALTWKFYFEIDQPSVLLHDNFECHVSEEGQRVVAEESNATVVPLPPNSTAVCQPLDVGVMGPLKAKIRSSGRCCSGGSAKEKRIRAIDATIAAWDAIKTETIIRSFRKAIPKHPEVSV
ncbi:hypothetical protein P3T76_004434 [Phytophthora citrophthora]|uniref:DDE-1 domain-containing protein n=1 Tax=Phytophthora citrophthora TaxID=4793 RepID=A0AAD9GTK8_9STRA|nr:hypothetical protein P3T76_004434 [Phytophthora citrophthora]